MANVVSKRAKKTVGYDELIDIEPVVAIVKDLVTRNIERMSILSSMKTLLIFFLILRKLEKLVSLCFLLKLVVIATMVYVILVLVLVLFLMSFTGKLCMRLVLVSLRTLMWLFTLITRKPFALLVL